MVLCDYGCGQKAIYQFKNGKKCCSKSHQQCKNMKKITSETSRGRKHTKETKLKISLKNKGRKRTFLSKKKMSESHRYISNETRRKMSESKTGKKRLPFSEVHRRRLSQAKSGNNNPNYGKKYSLDRRKQISINGRYSIKDYERTYPFFFKVEGLRYNPDKPGEKEIQVHCKNHNCPNSKEHGGWFTPTSKQKEQRIYYLEKEGRDLCNFYCFEECKNKCPIFQSKGNDPFKDILHPYLQSEYQQFREQVLNRDKYKCQYCGKKAEYVHHERPQKLEPFFSLDPDLAWSVCKECHYKYGHKDECSTGSLSSLTCS